MKQIRCLSKCPSGMDAYLSEHPTEPKSWVEFKSHDAGNSYKQLVNELIEIQHGLCGYCEIDLRDEDRQVEHVLPQKGRAKEKENALDYRNLIVCCLGGSRRNANENRRLDPIKQNLSCGQAKGGKTIVNFIDPRKLPDMPSLVKVNFDGRIVEDVVACRVHGVPTTAVKNTIRFLGLNCERLRRARENRWDALNENWSYALEDISTFTAAARNELLPENTKLLPSFFTTNRSYFGRCAEQVLAEFPRSWI